MSPSALQVNVAVIGGGVIGLSVAAALSPYLDEILLFERCDVLGSHQSSRNSEVIHAGIYYANNSLKARLCVRGRRILYDLAEKHGLRVRKCGKLIVAVTPEQLPALYALYSNAKRNNVEGLSLLDRAQVRAIEPNVNAVAAIYSSETGIIDSHGLLSYYRSTAEKNGVGIALCAEVTGICMVKKGWLIRYTDTSGDDEIFARAVINAAGFGAQAVMAMAGLDPISMGLALHLSKGEYFSVKGGKQNIVSRLVYPVPDENLTSLGIHTVVDLNGGLKLGPSAFYVDRIDYSVNPDNAVLFHQSASEYLPSLALNDLQPDMAGIRAKLSGAGMAARDFYIKHECEHGAHGFFNLVGIDSPGLTSSPAIGELVRGMVLRYLTH